MKRIVSLALLAANLVSAQAQLFGPESLAGGLIGGIAGGVIGHNSGRRAAEGAAIGAGAGLFLGALTSHPRERDSYYYSSTPVEGVAPSYSYYPYYYPRPVVVTRPVVWQPHATTVIMPAAPAAVPQPSPAVSVQNAVLDPAPSLVSVPGTPGTQGALGSANGLFGR